MKLISFGPAAVMMAFLAMLVVSPMSASAAPKQKAAKETISYTVKKGDSVSKIAKQYGVSSGDIVRWNSLGSDANIRIGQKLRIRVAKGSVSSGASSSGRPHNTRSIKKTYTVKKGDTLGKIAKKTGVPIDKLKQYNRGLRKSPDRLRVGQTLMLSDKSYMEIEIGPDDGRSASHGAANAGYLTGGVQLTSGPGYQVRNPKRAYGTQRNVDIIRGAMEAYHATFPEGPSFSIGDLSVERGGHLNPHLSHQSGRDIDVSYVKRHDGTVDVERNWFVLEILIRTGKMQYIFVDYALQKKFYDYARRQGYTPEQLKPMIQYPTGKKAQAIIRNWPGHGRHFHARFKCAESDVDCR